jgi:hypothetical protein
MQRPGNVSLACFLYKIGLIKSGMNREPEFIKGLTFEDCQKIVRDILSTANQRIQFDGVVDQVLGWTQAFPRQACHLIEVQTIDPHGTEWVHMLSPALMGAGPESLHTALTFCVGRRHAVDRRRAITFSYDDGLSKAVEWNNVPGFRTACRDQSWAGVMTVSVTLEWRA